MSELKTTLNDQDPYQLIASVEDPKKQADCLQLDRLMQQVTGKSPRMWGDAIVGYGSYRYEYKSGRQGDWMAVGFSPRKQNITIYLMVGFEQHQDLLERLGRHTISRSCLYIKRLADVDQAVLGELVKRSFDQVLRDNQPGPV